MGQDERLDEHTIVHCTSVAAVMRDLASEVHWNILVALVGRPRSVHEIVTELGVPQSTASKCLERLKQYHLVDYACKKNDHVYRLSGELRKQEHTEVLVVEFRASDSSFLIRKAVNGALEDS